MPLPALSRFLRGFFQQIFTRDGAAQCHLGRALRCGRQRSSIRCPQTLAVTYTTITPNFVVLGIASEHRLMIYHQIIPGQVLQITQNLGAKP